MYLSITKRSTLVFLMFMYFRIFIPSYHYMIWLRDPCALNILMSFGRIHLLFKLLLDWFISLGSYLRWQTNVIFNGIVSSIAIASVLTLSITCLPKNFISEFITKLRFQLYMESSPQMNKLITLGLFLP